jgi:hypothetical protein
MLLRQYWTSAVYDFYSPLHTSKIVNDFINLFHPKSGRVFFLLEDELLTVLVLYDKATLIEQPALRTLVKLDDHLIHELYKDTLVLPFCGLT